MLANIATPAPWEGRASRVDRKLASLINREHNDWPNQRQERLGAVHTLGRGAIDRAHLVIGRLRNA
jgi:hypothetical protein